MQTRRDFIATGTLAAGALAFGPAFWRQALAADQAAAGPGPYGPLGAPDANGISLPAGFTSREIARAGQVVPGTAYPWHQFPDGQATYAMEGGGWILVSNSETLAVAGAGSSAVRFDPAGNVTDAYRILAGTNANCAGGRTPWGMWLSCEEWDGGQVWECDPMGVKAAVARPALGVFKHEAAAVDPIGKRVYLTEDNTDGCFYRFTPTTYPDLSAGKLEVLVGAPGGKVTWKEVPDPSSIVGGSTRTQVADAAHFSGGEGIWYDTGVIYFSTKGEDRIYAYDTTTDVLEILFDGKAKPDAQVTGVDNLTVSKSGDLYVCEDNGDAEYSVVCISRERQVAAFATVSGPIHSGSELAGVIFDPSGKRMYFSSQRANGQGATYEVSGPFRTDPPPGANSPGSGDPAPLTPQPPNPNPPVSDVDGPGLSVVAGKTLSLASLVKRGFSVTVKIDQPGTVTVALRSDDLEKVRGARGSTDRPVFVTLARSKKAFKRAGRAKVVLKPTATARKRLRREKTNIRARITVQAKAASGTTSVSNRAVRITLPRR